MQKLKFILVGFILMTSIVACAQSPVLSKIKSGQYLLVATKIGKSSHFIGESGPAGFEYELVSRFAKSLNMTPQFIPFKSDEAIVQAVRSGKVHMAAAAMHPESKMQGLAYSEPYKSVELWLLYNKSKSKPKSAEQLDGSLLVAKDSGYRHLLPGLFGTTQSVDSAQLDKISANDAFNRVNLGEVDYTITHELEFQGNQGFYPNLRKAFALPQKWHLAWAFPDFYDDSLRQAANSFLAEQQTTGAIDQLVARYFKGKSLASPQETIALQKSTEEILPELEQSFREASKRTGLDWRLLAAISYQESKWRTDAVSPTGVKGLMMLTKATAKLMGVEDRTDPHQSIQGGAKLLLSDLSRIPERIQGKDRLQFALAAYNVGYGHLEDARVLTQKQGGNPDRWEDVRQRLPLLKDEEFHKQTKLGYARGDEPVKFVARVQHYYQMLIHLDNERMRQSLQG